MDLHLLKPHAPCVVVTDVSLPAQPPAGAVLAEGSNGSGPCVRLFSSSSSGLGPAPFSWAMGNGQMRKKERKKNRIFIHFLLGVQLNYPTNRLRIICFHKRLKAGALLVACSFGGSEVFLRSFSHMVLIPMSYGLQKEIVGVCSQGPPKNVGIQASNYV